MSKLEFYARQSRDCAAIARRMRYMRNDPTHELWAERARASYLMLRCVLAEATRK